MRENEQTPDRRPLVYGVFAVAILLVAAFLFWPQSEPQPDLVLTPDSLRAGVEDASSAGMEQLGDPMPDGTIDASEPTKLTHDGGPVVETHIDGTPVDEGAATTPVVETPKPVATPKTEPAKTTTTTSPSTTNAPKTSTPRTSTSSSSSLTQPGSTGEWVLNVGAYSTQANADRQVQELSRLGISAHVQRSSKDDGSPLYRVRVGFFPNSAAAKSYGEWLKRSQNLDSWAAKR